MNRKLVQIFGGSRTFMGRRVISSWRIIEPQVLRNSLPKWMKEFSFPVEVGVTMDPVFASLNRSESPTTIPVSLRQHLL